ncbi:9844_t:CDS:2 [Acaulospora colombiana]|uniref:9844_t:CDS:1 n=1 Tax=Acaulospora colombiana TaxID=27376 RepID=A0ACA9LBS0_9GLOM|nr:9844_t:CDS:2 [Acaulospora colombiana]
MTTSTQNDLVSETKRKRASEYEILTLEMSSISYSSPADSTTNSSKQQTDPSTHTGSKNDPHSQPTKRAKLLSNDSTEDENIVVEGDETFRKPEDNNLISTNDIGENDGGHSDSTGDEMQLDNVQPVVQNHMSQEFSRNGTLNSNGVGNHLKSKFNMENGDGNCKISSKNTKMEDLISVRTRPKSLPTNGGKDKITRGNDIHDNKLDNEKITNEYDQRVEQEKVDAHEFKVLLSKIMDILESRDAHQFLRNGRDGQALGTNAEGQALNSTIIRAKIESNQYNSLKGFQHDFVSIINDAMFKNPQSYDFGRQFIRFGSRLIEQAVKEVPSVKRHPGVVPKRSQKIALVQPTTNGHVFSSGILKQSILDNQKFKLVGDAKDVAVIPQQSMNDIPSLGALFPQKIKKPESELSQDLVVPGGTRVFLITSIDFLGKRGCDRSGSYLSYEDTMMVYAYKKAKKVTEDEENDAEKDAEMLTETDHDNLENESATTSNELVDQLNDSDITMDELFGDIDIEMIYESLEDEDNNNPLSDKKLDKNVKMFLELQRLQNKRFTTNPDVITSEERNLGMKLRKRLAEMISVVPPSKLVHPGSIEKAMTNLPIRESAFRGMLPPNNCRAYPSNEVSREAFDNPPNVIRPSESTQLTPAVARPTVMGPPPLPQSQARPRLHQTLSQIHAPPPPQPFQQPNSQIQAPHYHSQVQSSSQPHSQVHPQLQAQLRPQQPPPRPQATGYPPVNSHFNTEYGIPVRVSPPPIESWLANAARILD